MYLSTDGTDLAICGKLLLSAEYRSADGGSGRLTLRRTDPATYESHEVTIPLDPWSPEGFKIEEWVDAGGVVICGAARLLVLETTSLETRAAIPLEYEECEMRGQPSFVRADDILIISTERRVFCIDRRLAIRWCWTVGVYSNEWWLLARAPIVEGGTVRISMRSAKGEAEVRLRMQDALEIVG